mmetsp:Transcript_36616/g.59054  ORF Transcript_36616/g.59054 Transcript_36616/m.59054 type:complete len:94 (+) Transcript_36616:415-696(+)|eukprot:CAMPEP_0203764462 /NCGR_PEP_ID=MMETSP0098-20131031/17717_1 /ASSEMBLY_ACC=CAM_ASM_000208 /TAXON_ID=96639 /ORGANISM=" , Strain NY0313808BC1" /LENGTH=93 /DNA_ID=CAMNT_0050660341 /DNA_START=386 /DNA_END=670 /DNA_ORIENTATION=+
MGWEPRISTNGPYASEDEVDVEEFGVRGTRHATSELQARSRPPLARIFSRSSRRLMNRVPPPPRIPTLTISRTRECIYLDADAVFAGTCGMLT